MNSQGQPNELAGLNAAIARIERERQEHNEYVNRRFEELEQHADWLETRVGRLVALAAGTLIYFGLKQWQWLESPLALLVLSFIGRLVFKGIAMEVHKTPIPWRHIEHLPHLEQNRIRTAPVMVAVAAPKSPMSRHGESL